MEFAIVLAFPQYFAIIIINIPSIYKIYNIQK